MDEFENINEDGVCWAAGCGRPAASVLRLRVLAKSYDNGNTLPSFVSALGYCDDCVVWFRNKFLEMTDEYEVLGIVPIEEYDNG